MLNNADVTFLLMLRVTNHKLVYEAVFATRVVIVCTALSNSHTIARLKNKTQVVYINSI